MEKNKVIVLTTGGTIEKSYSELDGSLENRESLLKNKLLNKLRLPYTDVLLYEVMAKDSLYMDETDREKIWQQVEKYSSHGYPIVVLHGTDTMALSASYCFEKNHKPSIPIVFTGAMKPVGFDDSDATQNFIEALMICQRIAPGIYISFHNHLFELPNVRKNKNLGTFEKFKPEA